MFELFLNAPKLDVGVNTPPEWNFIKTGFQNNVNKVTNFYKTANLSVKSNHFLVRLLQSLTIPKSLDLERYYANVDRVSLNLSMVMKMTSSIYKGILHRGIFYGEDNPEILIAIDDFFDFEEVNRNWKNVSAVTTVLHPKSDLDIHLPNGLSYSKEKGLTVILINVPMLAVQYRAFWREQRRLQTGKTIMQFIAGYVLPNMLSKQLDLCIFNRLYNKFYKLNDGKNITYRNHSFAMMDYEAYMDIAIDKILINIDRCNKRFDVVLRQIPSIYNGDMYDNLMLPDLAPTMQVQWSTIAARLKTVNFLFDICGDDLRSRNQGQINQMLRSFRMNNSYYMMGEMLPNDLYNEAKGYIENILTSLKRNAF